MYILSILDQVSVTSSLKLKLTLLNLSDLKLLLTKLEDQLIPHPHLALLQWKEENIYYMYKFMKFQSFMLSNTPYVVFHVPLVDNWLQFNLYRIHNIPIVHTALKKSFKYSIQEEYLAVGSDLQYISFPLSDNIMVCQISNRQFCHITSPLYTADTSKSCSYALFLNIKARINSVCILSIINQTHDEAININDNFGAISTFQDDKKVYITCLQFSYTINMT